MAAPPENFYPELLERLTPLLGQHTARRALKLACDRAGRAEGTLQAGDSSAVVALLGPMLRTLVGNQTAQAVLQDISRRYG